jgi:hypothetical protein
MTLGWSVAITLLVHLLRAESTDCFRHNVKQGMEPKEEGVTFNGALQPVLSECDVLSVNCGHHIPVAKPGGNRVIRP